MDAEVWEIRIACRLSAHSSLANDVSQTIRIARSHWRSAEFIRIVAKLSALRLVIVSSLKGSRHGSSIDCRFIDTAELDVCCHTLADVEGVESQIAGVVKWEEAGVDDGLGVVFADAELDLYAFELAGDVVGVWIL